MKQNKMNRISHNLLNPPINLFTNPLITFFYFFLFFKTELFYII
jgi:hypothetical protein